jgi:hypothetical protein
MKTGQAPYQLSEVLTFFALQFAFEGCVGISVRKRDVEPQRLTCPQAIEPMSLTSIYSLHDISECDTATLLLKMNESQRCKLHIRNPIDPERSNM